MPVFAPEDLRTATAELFQRAGFPPGEAALIGRLIVEADRCGHESHGIRHVPRYIKLTERGHVQPGAQVTVVRETPTTAVLDGNRTMGHVAAARAAEVAIAKARQVQIAAVGARNQDHVGRVGAYPEQIAAAGLVGMAWVVAQGPGRLVAPFGGMERRLGTNPLAAAFPRADGPPVLIDFATSAVASNKVRVAAERGRTAGADWLLDAEGRPTTDPETYVHGGGMLRPLGGAQGHKGYALAAMVDLLSGVLAGAGTGRITEEEVNNNGVFLIAIDPEAFVERTAYDAEVRAWCDYLYATRTPPGGPPVQVPGDYEAAHRARSDAEGIAVDAAVWEAVAPVLTRYEVALPQARG